MFFVFITEMKKIHLHRKSPHIEMALKQNGILCNDKSFVLCVSLQKIPV